MFAWFGLSGEGLGGMNRPNPRASTPVAWSDHYEFSPGLDAIRGVPIQVWATRSFTARWSAPAPRSSSSRASPRRTACPSVR